MELWDIRNHEDSLDWYLYFSFSVEKGERTTRKILVFIIAWSLYQFIVIPVHDGEFSLSLSVIFFSSDFSHNPLALVIDLLS